MAGASSFTKTFPARGPRDKQGRSLRDFDLQTRLFRYPLSYMIYDAAFDALPDIARDRVYRKLFDALTGKESSGKYARLSEADRQAILEILRDTKSALPGYWRTTVSPSCKRHASNWAGSPSAASPACREPARRFRALPRD